MFFYCLVLFIILFHLYMNAIQLKMSLFLLLNLTHIHNTWNYPKDSKIRKLFSGSSFSHCFQFNSTIIPVSVVLVEVLKNDV